MTFGGSRETPRPRGPSRWLSPGLDDVYLVAALGVILIPTLAMAVSPNDFWFHLATAREIAASGQIPSQDRFSFTRYGEPYFNQPWLAQLFLYKLYELGGLELVIFIHALTITLAVGFLARLCRDLGASMRLTALVILLGALPMGAPNFGVRPQAFAILLFAVVLWAVWSARERAVSDGDVCARRLWLAPIGVLVWVNVHGSFPLALAVMGALLVGDLAAQLFGGRAPPPGFDRRLAFAILLAAAATLCNPAGWKVWAYVATLSTSSVVSDYVMEWQTPIRASVGTGIAFFIVLLGQVVSVGLAKRRPDLAESILTLGLLSLALSALRHTAWFGFVAAALLGRLWASSLADRPTSQQGKAGINRSIVGVLALLATLCLPWVRADGGTPLRYLHSRDTPVAAVEAIDALPSPPSRLFTELGYGSYLIWARPHAKVFIDPRFELYTRQLLRDYRTFSAGEDIDRIVEEYALDGILADRVLQAPLVSALAVNDGWELAYQDDEAALFVRRAK